MFYFFVHQFYISCFIVKRIVIHVLYALYKYWYDDDDDDNWFPVFWQFLTLSVEQHVMILHIDFESNTWYFIGTDHVTTINVTM